ncbi:MAG TPA: LemA family protein [Candidatus Polarisedimenticolia bacterium]|nr:LemA family protein [Candidatus Polarisedimenticolia bacterium]
MMLILLLAVAVTGIVVVGWAAGLYNQLIGVRVNVDRSWSNIEVLEKQRYDEIPKLVKVCEGYMQYERDTLQKVIAARTRYLGAAGPADRAAAGAEMATALKSLFALAESYPDLKANANFTQLQSRITALESEIADRREFYNDSVAIYNARLEQVPYVFFARPLGYQPRAMYKVAPAETVAPDIKFELPKAKRPAA